MGRYLHSQIACLALYFNVGHKSSCTSLNRLEIHGLTPSPATVMISAETFANYTQQFLGINAPPQDRLSLRVAKECSVLQTDGYMKAYTGSNISELFPSWYPAELLYGYSMQGLAFNAFFYGPNGAASSKATYISRQLCGTSIP